MLETFGLSAEMEEVERRLRRSVHADEPLLEEMARYVVESGGKRIRPLAAILAFHAVRGPPRRSDEVIEIATGLELIHSATLVHDDINDGARTRRGRESLWSRYGAARAIIAGDFLFTKGFQISGRFDDQVVEWTGEACRRLAEGEILQARHLNDPSISLDDYRLLIARKTASFIETGIRIGAYLGGATPQTIERLASFGLELGLAFQIIDDLLDVIGDGERTGKRVGIDIHDGNTTLPAILALRRGGPGSVRLAAILSAADRTRDDVDEALSIIRASGAVAEAEALAREHGERARQTLASLDGAIDHDRLATLVDLVLDRDL